MSHTVKEKAKLLLRVKRVRGQVDALERALESEKGCVEVLHQIAAIRGAMNALMTEVIEEHVLSHIAGPEVSSQAERNRGAEELIEVVRTYLK
jgi:DNA-binding FrmR family transcriptional regulator